MADKVNMTKVALSKHIHATFDSISLSFRVVRCEPPRRRFRIRNGGRLLHRPNPAELRSRNGMDAADPEEEAEKGEGGREGGIGGGRGNRLAEWVGEPH